MAAREIEVITEENLLERARHGDVAAHDELARRHVAAAWGLAAAATRELERAETVAALALAEVLSRPASGAVVDPAVRPRLFAAVRRAAATAPHAEGGEATPVGRGPFAEAFAGLPERRRSALWLADVEGATDREVASALGLSVEASAALVDRSRVAFADRVLAAYSQAVDAPACRSCITHLSEYAAGRLAARDARGVREHLDRCARCDELLTAIDDLAPALARIAPPVPATLISLARFRWQATLVRDTGPLHLTWIGGRPVPPWAERALAGSAAAVVALGISTAVLLAGRGGTVGDDRLARQDVASAPHGLPDGESALGGADPLGDLPPLPSITAAPAPEAGATVGGESVARSADPIPTATTSPRPTVPSAPGSETSSPPTTEAPGPGPSTTEPALEIVAGVPGVASVSVGDECTGVDLLGTVVGCEPTATDDVVDVGGSLLGGLGL